MRSTHSTVADGEATGTTPSTITTGDVATWGRAPLAFALAWLTYLGVLQWSVVRFRIPIVLALTACAAGLAWWLARRAHLEVPARVASVVLVLSAAFPWVVPLFTYLRGGPAVAAKTVVTLVALACAALLWEGALRARDRRAGVHRAAYVVAVVGHLVLAAVTIVGSPHPKIDVWVILQQSADALARGENFYDVTWSGSPGVKDMFTYLPWTAVLLAPGRWVAGDVRWALLVWSLVLFAGVWQLAKGLDRDGAHRAAAATRAAVPVAWLVVAPGGITQVDQAWTEPLLAACVVWWAVLVHRGRAWWAVVPLALACASKQHLAAVLPILLLWRPFGWRRAVATGALTGVLIAPWFVANPAAFLDDTVIRLVGFHAIKFANTWYLLFLNTFGVQLPFAVTAVAVLGTLAAAVRLVHRRQPGLGELLRWWALVLLVANLVNKQGFYNQFWLSAALVAASVALPPDEDVVADGIPGAGSARQVRAPSGEPATAAPARPG